MMIGRELIMKDLSLVNNINKQFEVIKFSLLKNRRKVFADIIRNFIDITNIRGRIISNADAQSINQLRDAIADTTLSYEGFEILVYEILDNMGPWRISLWLGFANRPQLKIRIIRALELTSQDREFSKAIIMYGDLRRKYNKLCIDSATERAELQAKILSDEQEIGKLKDSADIVLTESEDSSLSLL
jgi:hypothetical protein